MKKYLPFICILSFLFACKKDGQNNKVSTPVVIDVFTVALESATNINVTDFTLKGSLQITSASTDIEYGFIFSSFPDVSIYQGKVIGIGKSQVSIDYNYVLTGLDTGKTYYCRAYALLANNVVYSSITTVGKVAPSITSISIPDTLSNPTVISVSTNFKNLSSSDKIAVYLGNTVLTITATNPDASGTTFVATYPGELPIGSYNFTLKFNNININYTAYAKFPQGIWTKVGQLSYIQGVLPNQTFGFVKDGWIYSYRLIVGTYPAVPKTTFFKQNIQTGVVVNLSTFDQDTFILAPGITFVGNTVHFIGGEENDTHNLVCVKSHYIYNIDTDSWTKEADFPGAIRRSAATMVYNNKIYYGLGYNIPDPNNINTPETDRNDMWAYDLQTKQWLQMASFLEDGRSHSASFSIASKLYIVGGYDRITPQYSTWCYDAETNAWNRKADFPGAGFEDAASFQNGQYGYVGLGTEGPNQSNLGPSVSYDFFGYDPFNNKWTPVPGLIYNAVNTISGSNSQYGIIAGGYSSFTYPQDIYTYKP